MQAGQPISFNGGAADRRIVDLETIETTSAALTIGGQSLNLNAGGSQAFSIDSSRNATFSGPKLTINGKKNSLRNNTASCGSKAPSAHSPANIGMKKQMAFIPAPGVGNRCSIPKPNLSPEPGGPVFMMPSTKKRWTCIETHRTACCAKRSYAATAAAILDTCSRTGPNPQDDATV